MALSYYQQNTGSETPTKATNWWEDDEENLPGPTTEPLPTAPTTGTTGIATTGAPSPATQIQNTGNTATGMPPPPPGGSTTPSTPQTTTGTPSSATGSGLPAYGSNWTFNWLGANNTSNPYGTPGTNTTYQGPQTLYQAGIDFSQAGNYNPQGAQPLAFEGIGETADPSYAALKSLLSGDASGMDTSAIKNRLKEQRLMMEQDQLGASRQAAAARGMLDSGWQGADERRIGAGARKDILGGFREVDIEAAKESTKNKLTASEILNQVLSGDMDRASTLWGNNFKRAGQIDDQARFAADFGLRKESEKAQAQDRLENTKISGANQNLKSWQGGVDAQTKARDQDIEIAQGKTNELIARLGLAVNLEQIAQGSARDKMQFLSDMFEILVKQEQFNAQMGFNYNQLGMSMNEMMANLAKSIGV